MTWPLPDPMLTAPVASPDLPPGSAAEPKWDGYRAQLARYVDGRMLLRSRQGTDMTAAFWEIGEAALARLPEAGLVRGCLSPKVSQVAHLCRREALAADGSGSRRRNRAVRPSAWYR
ncbi:hypothetical protein ACFXAS_20980 [Streptomyces sp. NPDC059459]|uniref:ATP-dependent DNA ligase n=1 Tax=Streptomyces sp. NPDC059459 TaxID=3346839 RepID=UPI0036C3B8FE